LRDFPPLFCDLAFILMLFSTEKCVAGRRPAYMAWFGNFFEPYFSSEDAVVEGLEDLRSLGINSIVLDSKLWSDFTRYFQTGEMSPYVRMQDFIARRAEEMGLGVSFLALFAIGDNLYPEIYDHPPEFVEPPVDVWGQPFRGYRHWSERQTAEHVRHCLDLYRQIARGAAAKAVDENGNERLPFYFYHSPIFAPSFDEDGRVSYLRWLKGRYSLEELNARYGTAFPSFEAMHPEDYWTNPAHPSEEGRHVPASVDYEKRSAAVRKYADNQRYKREVMRAYFADIVGRLRREEPRFYFFAALSQWKLFFSDFVHIQNRGWDLWDLGPILDSPSFITMPIDHHGQVEPYVVPCEMAMLRSATADRDFVGSLFLGRYMANDVYAVCSPAEVIASAFGAGATELYFYGYNGLDDGGNFGKWGEAEKASLRGALDWFAAVRDVAGRRTKTRRAALIFPQASFTLSAPATDPQTYQAFRDDLLGWYRQLADLGLNADILHPSQIRDGGLSGYACVVVPADPHYWAMPDPELEAELRRFVEAGGLLFHSMADPARAAFGLEIQPHAADSFGWEEKVVTGSAEFVLYASGEIQAAYLSDQRPAYVLHRVGRGTIHSFGFHYGYAYGCREHLPVPRIYKKENHYPLTMLKRTPVDRALTEAGLSARRSRGVEWIAFENGTLIVNHTPYTTLVPQGARALSTFEGFDGTHLPGRHAVFVGAAEDSGRRT
jgi:hypothetical protein